MFYDNKTPSILGDFDNIYMHESMSDAVKVFSKTWHESLCFYA